MSEKEPAALMAARVSVSTVRSPNGVSYLVQVVAAQPRR